MGVWGRAKGGEQGQGRVGVGVGVGAVGPSTSVFVCQGLFQALFQTC